MFALDLNYIAIIVMTIFNIVLGMLWYSPAFLGEIWARAHKFDPSSLKPDPFDYVGAIVVSFITAWVLAGFTHYFDIVTLKGGAELGFFIWLGFVATTHFSGVIWAKKSFKAFLIDVGFQLVSLVVMGAVLAIWQ